MGSQIIKLVFALLMIISVCSCCTSEFCQFNEQSLIFATDKRIDQKEYETLVELIKQSNDRGFVQFKAEGDKVDDSKVIAYLLKYFAAKKISLTSSDIWQPVETSSENLKFNINVFLENSASMDGYVNDNSTFKTTIFKLLTDLKNFSSTDSLNLNYINTKSINIKTSATRDDIDDFYKRLNPADFQKGGGKREQTDIEKMLKVLLDKTNNRNLSVFISDCVFSPGKRDAKKYLDGQYAAIYNDFVNAKSLNPDLSVIILQCVAKFEGIYYDYLDKEHKKINIDRPYYIWFLGNSTQIKNLVDNKIFDLIKNGFSNKLIIQSIKAVNQPNFKILYRPRIGEFDSKLLAQKIITNASVSKGDKTSGQFGFNIAVDFSQSMQDVGYFLDTTNYKLSNKNYNLSVENISDKSDASLKDFTHILKLQTNDLKEESLQIDVIGKTPSWIYLSTSTDDSKIEKDASEKLKTFGFKFLVEGVCDAFFPKSQLNIVNEIKITIKK